MQKLSKFEQIEEIFINDPFKLSKAHLIDYQRRAGVDLILQLHHAETIHSIKFKLVKILKTFFYLNNIVLDKYIDHVAAQVKAVLDAPDK